MSQLQESSEETMERHNPYGNMNDHPILQTNDNQFDLAEDSVRRQKINQEENPMDEENEQSLMRNARLNNNPIQQQNQAVRASDDKFKFGNRQSILADDLLNDGELNQEDLQVKLMMRNKMIFDQEGDMEGSHRNNQNHEAQEMQRQTPQNQYQQMVPNLKPSLQQPQTQTRPHPNTITHEAQTKNDCHFTLNKYESKPDLQKKIEEYNQDSESQMQTAHFKKQGNGSEYPRTNTEHTQKTENPGDPLLEMRRLENEDTGQFGGASKWEDTARKSTVDHVEVDHFRADEPVINHGSSSPTIKQSKGESDQISQLLAQLQAPMTLDHLADSQKRRGTEPELMQKQVNEFDIEQAHQQMQASIKQMKLVADPSEGMGFNGQNSLYELANRVGHPLSSSNLNSMSNYDNVEDFQKFLHGEGSLRSQNTYGVNQGADDRAAYEQAQQLMIQMQDSDFSHKNKIDQYNIAAADTLKQQHQMPMVPDYNNEQKENYNRKNQSQMVMLNVPSAQNIQEQPPAPKIQMSLAARANQAKLAREQQQQVPQQLPQYGYQPQMQLDPPAQQNYRKTFDPASVQNPQPISNREYDYHQTYNHNPPPQVQYEALKQQQEQLARANSGLGTEFSKTNKNEKLEKRKALLAQYDDIPIHQLHKAEGYQLRNIDDESDTSLQNINAPNVGQYSMPNQAQFDKTDEDVENMTVKDQVFSSKWKVRLTAFKAINRLFIDYEGPSRELQKEDEMYGDPENPFDQYGPIIEQMIKDQNLTAQYEGLNCLYSFVKLGQDIKQVSHTCTPYILDKVQHNKPNLKDITEKILLTTLDRRQNITPELIKRFKSKNAKVVHFCLSVLVKALVERHLEAQDANLRLIFKSTHELLGFQTKDVRDAALQLITIVYENCGDDLNTFTANISSLRPVQLRELTEQLQTLTKNPRCASVRLFEKLLGSESRKDLGGADKSPANRSKSVESQGQPTDPRDHGSAEEDNEVDLLALLPANFSEIPYISQINVKRKALESVNAELLKLVQKNADVKLQKDYSQIFNIVVHMLEDPNMLVFIEGIKMIEHLAVLLKQAIKVSKMKQFLSLLADKYKETKTAVLAALERTFDAIYANRCLPDTKLFDLLINNISATHKNPRVKQLVIDRVELIIEKNFMVEFQAQNVQQLQLVFKSIKEKLKQIILKDTNAQVRDAGVSLLAQFRIILGAGGRFEDFQAVLEIVNALPKQRVAEISRRIEAFEQENPNHAGGGEVKKPVSARNDGSRSARSRSRGHSAKRGPKQANKSAERNAKSQPATEESEPHPSPSEQVFLFNTKKAQAIIPGHFQASSSQIMLTIKNLSQDRDRLRAQQIQQNLEQGIEDLGDEGVVACKGTIITCVYWLLTNYVGKVNFQDPERQGGVKALLSMMKRIYCIERSMAQQPQVECGAYQFSQEMFQAVSAAVICFALVQDSFKLIAQLLNILNVASTANAESSLNFLNALKYCMFKYNPATGKAGQEPSGRTLIMSNVIYFVSDKLEDFMLKSQMNENLNQSLQLKDFEEFRSIVIQSLQTEAASSDNDKQILIQSLVYLKDKMNEYQQKTVQQMQSSHSSQFQGEQQSPMRLQNHDTFAAERLPPKKEPYLEVLELIEANFEQGLLKLKELVKSQQMGQLEVTFEQKERIVNLLLQLTTKGYKNPQEQYKQAYSLKALMWLKDEFIGLEETFKLTVSVMDAFSRAILDSKDSSIEQYLLNFWTKDLSLRDTVDRIHIHCRFSGDSQKQEFLILFKWVLSQKLQTMEAWQLDDFRKLAKNIAEAFQFETEVQDFVDSAVNEFGAKKVREFMEIQLISDNDLLLRFLDTYDMKYGTKQAVPDRELPSDLSNKNAFIKIAKNNNSQIDDYATDRSLQEPLLTGRSNAGDRSQLLQELRDKKKEKKVEQNENEFQSTLEDEKKKYEDIMQRLDAYKSQRQTTSQAPVDEKIQIDNVSANPKRITTSNTAQGYEADQRPASDYNNRYGSALGIPRPDATTSLEEFNEDEDFKLSTDNHLSLANSRHLSQIHQQKSDDENKQPFMHNRLDMQTSGVRTTNMTGKFGEGLHQLSESVNATPMNDSQLQESRKKLQDSVQYQEERMQRLESSQIKVRKYRADLETLELQKKKLEYEKEMLLAEQNKESEQWKDRYREMTLKNDEIISNLAEANQCYLRQVSDNEKLSQQILELQEQHRDFVQKYKEMQEQLESSQKEIEKQKIALEESQGHGKLDLSPRNLPRSRGNAVSQSQVIEQKQMEIIEKAFDKGQMMAYGDNLSEGQIGVHKIQELLLDSEGASKNLSKPMIFHYQKLKSKVDRMQMIHALKVSLENEDVLYAINMEVYKSLLTFLLRAFSFEKELIERESLQQQHERECQNELTQESQRLVSRLLNAKEFTSSLMCLLQLLRQDAMPEDFTLDLSIAERQYLRVLMRCISRITKALHSENPDLVRAFDVLVEMQKLFNKHPPENLRQDLPCLQDFDFVYRGLKDVSDKLIGLQPQKCQNFLDFCEQNQDDQGSEYRSQNAFFKYVKQMMQVRQTQVHTSQL